MDWNVFISHAGEDKASVARPLAELLLRAGLKVWLDSSELTLGDSLSRKIDEGLARSDYGVVILSKDFFRKAWPTHELAGLVARQIEGRKVILPVLHQIDHSYVLQYSPTLADAVTVSTAEGIQHVADEIVRAVRARTGQEIPPPAPRRSTRSRVLVLGILCATVAVSVAARIYWNSRQQEKAYRPDPDESRVLIWRRNRNSMDGYITVSCSTCSRPRAWAFHLPARKEGMPVEQESLRTLHGKNPWPLREFLYPDDKPHTGSCVDVPQTACQPPYDNYPWKPSHALQKAKPVAPVLRLDLRLLIGGYELLVTNEGEALARQINIDVAAWQPGSPGVEFSKTYAVRDLSPWADFNIARVFGD